MHCDVCDSDKHDTISMPHVYFRNAVASEQKESVAQSELRRAQAMIKEKECDEVVKALYSANELAARLKIEVQTLESANTALREERDRLRTIVLELTEPERLKKIWPHDSKQT